MADFDSKLPIRSLAADNETRIANSSNTIIDPATEATLQAIQTAVEIIDDWDDGSNRANVNIQTNAPVNVAQIAGTATSVNTGNADAGTQRVVLATDQPSVPVSFDEGNTDQVSEDTATAIASSASDSHSFTPGANLRVKKVQGSASGQQKIEVLWGVTSSEVKKHTFFTSKGSLNWEFSFPDGVALTPSDTIIITRTNFDNQAQDLYSSIVYQLD